MESTIDQFYSLNLNTNTLPGEDLELGPSMLLDFSPLVYLLTRA